MQNRPKAFFLLAFFALWKEMCFGQLKCPWCAEPAANPSPVQAPMTSIRAQMSLLGCRDGGTPFDRQGRPFFLFFPFKSKCKFSKSVLSRDVVRWLQQEAMLLDAYERCDFLHLSCRLPFTDECAEGLTMPQKWLKLLGKGRNWSQVLQGSCTRLPCTSEWSCSQVNSLSKSRSHQQI